MNFKTLVAFNRKIVNLFLSKNTYGGFFLWRTFAQDATTLISMSSQKEKVQKYAGFDVGAHAAQSTHSVCLISVFFVHFVYLLGRFSEVNIGYLPPLYKPTLFIKVVIFFVFTPLCHILCHDFLLFSMLLYYFFTHISL